ncbi:hypothetical protein Asi02nite_03060 [Asanoa siamensis]|uniref:Uncharacterized protein n=1 Tax=Asanoa siamensis TaxID=926357 RepID=A0ABQ4CHL4_9ACTN|nr:hypothetical protein Asi02nite_03060 [Asanoa siamensis]
MPSPSPEVKDEEFPYLSVSIFENAVRTMDITFRVQADTEIATGQLSALSEWTASGADRPIRTDRPFRHRITLPYIGQL